MKFTRLDAHKFKRLGEKWRKPKGKMGMRKKILKPNKGRHPQPGYGSPKASRGKHPSGLKELPVKNVADLEKWKEGFGIRIGKVGLKKKIQIVKAALEKKIPILNLKNPEEWLKKVSK